MLQIDTQMSVYAEGKTFVHPRLYHCVGQPKAKK